MRMFKETSLIFSRQLDRVETLGRDKRLVESGLFEAAVVERLAREHLAGTYDHARPLWLLFVFAEFLNHLGSQSAPIKAEAIA